MANMRATFLQWSEKKGWKDKTISKIERKGKSFYIGFSDGRTLLLNCLNQGGILWWADADFFNHPSWQKIRKERLNWSINFQDGSRLVLVECLNFLNQVLLIN